MMKGSDMERFFCTQVNPSDIILHSAIREHFQLQDHEDVDFEMFDHLVRKIVSLSQAFTGMETIDSISFKQAQMLLNHEWPTGGEGGDEDDKKNKAKTAMIKVMLGKGKKMTDPQEEWVSPFGKHFPNPNKKSNYSFYHDTYCPETKTYEAGPTTGMPDSEGLLWKALSGKHADNQASSFIPSFSGRFCYRCTFLLFMYLCNGHQSVSLLFLWYLLPSGASDSPCARDCQTPAHTPVFATERI